MILKKRKKAILKYFIYYIIFFLATAISLAKPTFLEYGYENMRNFQEDSLYVYTLNVSNPEPTMTFGIMNISSSIYGIKDASFFYWVSLNTTNGTLIINATENNKCGLFNITFFVMNEQNEGDISTYYFNGTPVNDAPYFVNLTNITTNATFFQKILLANDEEGGELNFSVNFTDCDLFSPNAPEGEDRCNLFELIEYNETAANISFNMESRRKGSYIINFSVKDVEGAISSQIVNWTFNWLEEPYFTYLCDDERTALEKSTFSCRINFSDDDEKNNLTIRANYSWFLFNATVKSNILNVSRINGNYSALVEFNITNEIVGTWFINLTLTDSQNNKNSTIINFSFLNVNDEVSLDPISFNQIAYNTTIYEIYVNATDDDLKIQQKNIYNEVLSFASNLSWVQITPFRITGNITTAKITIDATQGTPGINYSVRINVTDKSGSYSYRDFLINVSSNTKPSWSLSTPRNFTINENASFYLNLTEYVSDLDKDPLIFEYDSAAAFKNFSLNRTTGIINFTADDEDIGFYSFNISVSDSKSEMVNLSFNFTINNINDLPFFEETLTTKETEEDMPTLIYFFVIDNDYKIPQKDFYEENLTINWSIEGRNKNLLSFQKNPSFPTELFPNKVQFEAYFTPNKTDVGSYNITVNITDKSGGNISMTFRLDIFEVQHPPRLEGVTNITSAINETLFIDLNATDIEDGEESDKKMSFFIEELTENGNFLTINETTGKINITLKEEHAGFWLFNVSVKDSSDLTTSKIFWLKVYNYPKRLFPTEDFNFEMKENETYLLNFSINESVGFILNETANYTLYINDVFRNSTTGFVNGTNFYWNFTPYFNDRTEIGNLTLIVSNIKLNSSFTWNLTINNTEYPLTQIKEIENKSGINAVSLTLSDYFLDYDAIDPLYNQTIEFTCTLINSSGGQQEVSITNWTNGNVTEAKIIFRASSYGISEYFITAFEINSSNGNKIRNITTKNFTIEITTEQKNPAPSTGGGGGSVQKKKASIKLILPSPLNSKMKDSLFTTIGVMNNGETKLEKTEIYYLLQEELKRNNWLEIILEKTEIDVLLVNQTINISARIIVNSTEKGTYWIEINATSKEPFAYDEGKIYININEEEDLEKKILFIEEFIVQNPECLEIKEIIDKAKEKFKENDLKEAKRLTEEALQSCKNSISQKRTRNSSRIPSPYSKYLNYLAISILISFILGVLIYYFMKLRLRKKYGW